MQSNYYDSKDQIEKCLNCRRRECVNCLSERKYQSLDVGDKHKMTSVKQVDPVSGEQIKWYRSIYAAAKATGTTPDSIKKCILGMSETAGKYKWVKC